jgi:hypothetical protein
MFSFGLLIASCTKDSTEVGKSSVKVISTVNEPKQVRSVVSTEGNLLVYTNSEELVPVTRQEVFILNADGEVLKTVLLSDTIFQYINAVAAPDGGFLLCASSNTFSTNTIYHIGENGDIIWWKRIPVIGGSSIYGAYPAIGRDNSYLIMYQSAGSGFYIWKGDASGNEIFTRKIPSPDAVHSGGGIDRGHKYSRLIQAK